LTEHIVARRYARALFALGRKEGLQKLEKLGQDFDALEVALKASPNLADLYKNPLFSAEEKNRVAQEILGAIGADEYTKRFCALLAEKGRMGSLGDIIAVYRDLLDVEKGVLRGELVTAVPIDDKKRSAVRKQLEQQAGRALDLAYSVDPGILGGIILKVGDRVLDSSLRAQLSFLKENIKRGV
jgi:F-type H+-transporting ATPase subunit delta